MAAENTIAHAALQHAVGVRNGHARGHEQGLQEGLAEGHTSGHAEGLFTGYNAGALEAATAATIQILNLRRALAESQTQLKQEQDKNNDLHDKFNRAAMVANILRFTVTDLLQTELRPVIQEAFYSNYQSKMENCIKAGALKTPLQFDPVFIKNMPSTYHFLLEVLPQESTPVETTAEYTF